MTVIEELKILLAEDNRLNQRLAILIFNRMGISIDIASNGQEALEMVHKKKYDLILMDVQMPVMDGLEATERIRAFENESNIAPQTLIVALTATDVIENRNVCIEVGMDDFLEKPIMEPILRELFSRLFE
jgi:CheY-like chemotaxis protein